MQRRTRFTGKAMTALALVSVAALGLSACGGSSDSGTGGSGDDIAVTLITKDRPTRSSSRCRRARRRPARRRASTLTIAAGKADGDEDGQVKAIENAIARGDKGILITPNGPG